MGTNPYLYLPIDMKQELCVDLLHELGIQDIRHNFKRHELTHACLLSDYHTDQEKNPTCSLNYDKLTVHCLGCKGSGSLLWFIAVARGESSKAARKWVEKKAGGDGEKDLNFLLKYFDALYSQRVEKEPIPVYDKRIVDTWSEDIDAALDYLDTRGIDHRKANRFGLGYDREKDALVIPHYWRDLLVGWQARGLSKQWSGPKYSNTPRFPKADTLYNFWGDTADDLKEFHLVPKVSGLVMEAPLSVVRHPTFLEYEKDRVLESVATFGASVSKEQIEHLRLYDEIVLWFDNDPAGWGATEKVGRALLGHSVWAVESPLTGDPGDYSTEVVEDILKHNIVPFPVWNRPEALLCYKCYELEHKGDCDGI